MGQYLQEKKPLVQFYVHVDWPNTDNSLGRSTGMEIG